MFRISEGSYEYVIIYVVILYIYLSYNITIILYLLRRHIRAYIPCTVYVCLNQQVIFISIYIAIGVVINGCIEYYRVFV